MGHRLENRESNSLRLARPLHTSEIGHLSARIGKRHILDA